MTTALKRTGAALLTLLMFCMLTLGASAAANTPVGVKFWKENSDKESMANSGIDSDREATLARQSNGTYTLMLPVKQVTKLNVTGCLTGLTIGDVTYTGTLTGEIEKGNGILTIKNLPASVLTGSDVSKALTVTCNIQMDLSLLGEINTTARMCIWQNKPHDNKSAVPPGTALLLFSSRCAFPQSRRPFYPAASPHFPRPSSPCAHCGASGACSG